MSIVEAGFLEHKRALIERGWPTFGVGISVMLYVKSDQIMLEWFSGSEVVGQYSVAARVAESIYFLPMILSTTFVPLIGKSVVHAEADFQLKRFYRLSWLLGVAMAVISVFTIPFSDTLGVW